jgi:hypothetical protein
MLSSAFLFFGFSCSKFSLENKVLMSNCSLGIFGGPPCENSAKSLRPLPGKAVRVSTIVIVGASMGKSAKSLQLLPGAAAHMSCVCGSMGKFCKVIAAIAGAAHACVRVHEFV